MSGGSFILSLKYFRSFTICEKLIIPPHKSPILGICGVISPTMSLAAFLNKLFSSNFFFEFNRAVHPPCIKPLHIYRLPYL